MRARPSNNVPSSEQIRLDTIVAGGQTGVDRAALDAALDAGMAAGGWCPRGRRAEDGEIADSYPLRETPSDAYDQRTSWNVRDSDATLVIVTGEPGGGTVLTIQEARRLGRPYLTVTPDAERIIDVRRWLAREGVETLNVAGPRESTEPGIYARAHTFLRTLFGGL